MDSFVFYYWVLRGLILDTIPLLDKRFENIFSCCLSFHPFPMHFHKAKVLNFVRSSLLLSSLKPFCLTLDPKDVLLYFSLKGLYFYIFMFYIYIQIHFELIFIYEWGWGQGSFFSLWLSSCSCTIYWKAVLPLTCFCTYVKNQLSIFVCICFWILCFIPLFCVSVPLPFPHCLAHCSYIISLNTRWSGSFHFILLGQECLSYSRACAFSM